MVCASRTFLCIPRARYIVSESDRSDAVFRYCSPEKAEEGHTGTQWCVGRYSNLTHPNFGATLLSVHLLDNVCDLFR
jgi:hypothetical protein